MTGTSVLFMLLGAALLAAGMLVSALADRIRGLRTAREPGAPRATREKPVTQAPRAIAAIEPAEMLRSEPPKQRVPKGPSTSPVKPDGGGEDVIAALIAAGYKKPVATDAAWACTSAERATIEAWTAAALRKAGRAGRS